MQLKNFLVFSSHMKSPLRQSLSQVSGKKAKKAPSICCPPPPISKLLSCNPAEKNIDVGGTGVQKKEFSSQMIVLRQVLARIVALNKPIWCEESSFLPFFL